jgi:hypothetical protein
MSSTFINFFFLFKKGRRGQPIVVILSRRDYSNTYPLGANERRGLDAGIPQTLPQAWYFFFFDQFRIV